MMRMPFAGSTDIALLLLRLSFGFAMIFGHGWPKLMKFFSDSPLEFGDPLGVGVTTSLTLAIFAEVFCSLLVMLGAFTRWALIPLIITMLVVIFLVHLSDPFTRMEKAILFLTVYLSLWLTGPGRYSVDAQFRHKVS